MSSISRLEQRLAAAVEGALAKVGARSVNPAEAAGALEREADDKKLVVGRGRTLVPHHYTLWVSPADAARLGEHTPEVSAALAAQLAERAAEHRWTPTGEIRVRIREDRALRPGHVRASSTKPENDDEVTGALLSPVEAEPANAEEAPRSLGGRPRVEVRSRRGEYTATLVADVTSVGRGESAEIRIEDRSVSRRHGKLEVRGECVHYTDLDSTNGSRVNGREVTFAILQDGDQLQIGTATLTIRT